MSVQRRMIVNSIISGIELVIEEQPNSPVRRMHTQSKLNRAMGMIEDDSVLVDASVLTCYDWADMFRSEGFTIFEDRVKNLGMIGFFTYTTSN